MIVIIAIMVNGSDGDSNDGTNDDDSNSNGDNNNNSIVMIILIIMMVEVLSNLQSDFHHKLKLESLSKWVKS